MTSAGLGRLLSPELDQDQDSQTGRTPMIEPETENSSPALQEAARELQAAQHDVQVAFDCIALGELERAHEHALTARVAADAAVTALAAVLGQPGSSPAGRA
jgi:hypothetical protein